MKVKARVGAEVSEDERLACVAIVAWQVFLNSRVFMSFHSVRTFYASSPRRPFEVTVVTTECGWCQERKMWIATSDILGYDAKGWHASVRSEEDIVQEGIELEFAPNRTLRLQFCCCGALLC